MSRERLRSGFAADGCIHKFVYDHNDLLIHRNAVFDLKGHFEDIAFRVHRIGRHTDSELDFALIGKRLVIKDNKVVPGTKVFHNIQLFKPDKFERIGIIFNGKVSSVDCIFSAYAQRNIKSASGRNVVPCRSS